MCFPQGSSIAQKVAATVEKHTAVGGVSLDSVSGAPRQMALKSGLSVPNITGVAVDITKQRQRVA